MPVVAFAVTMAGDSPVKDGEALGSRGKQVKDGFVTVGVVDVGGNGVALVDCGDDRSGKAVIAELKMDESAVKAIFITHGHPDHTDGCAKFPKADVYAMAAEKDLVEGRVGAKGPMPKMFGAKDVGARVTHTLQDGEVPGHTAGSAAYLADGETLEFAHTGTLSGFEPLRNFGH